MSGEVTPAMVAAAWDVWDTEAARPYEAHVADHVTADMTPAERTDAIAALRFADLDAQHRNNDLMRRTLAAALNVTPDDDHT